MALRPEPGDRKSLWFAQDAFDPDTSLSSPGRFNVLSRDQFFQNPVVMVYGEVFSVRDVILFEAHVCGAVHAGAP
jgi:hypothetical protein